MKVLLTNDDGIEAPGLRALNECVRHAFQSSNPQETLELIVVAPDRGRSECSHSIETGKPLHVTELRDGWHSVDGTPVDCIRVAYYAMGFVPDVVFSGINAGANLGVNLMVSGTFAAAREATLLGIPAMAASHYRKPGIPNDWEHTPAWLVETLGEFLEIATNRKADGNRPELWNVNLPAIEPDATQLPPRVVCPVDRCPIDRTGTVEGGGRIRFELDFHGRAREPGRDVDQCFAGRITISKVDVHLGQQDPIHGSAERQQ